jgi:hypothetical protein
MAEEGKATGITLEQLSSLARITYEGRYAQLFYHRFSDDGSSIVGLDDQMGRWTLYGYVNEDDEFIELDRERE